MRKKAFLGILFFALTFTVFGKGNDSTLLKNTELVLQKALKQLSVLKEDHEQNKLNDSILKHFRIVLSDPLSFFYPFDSLKNIGKIRSDDEDFNFYTWNVPYKRSAQKICGFIQHRLENDSVVFIELTDMSAALENVENTMLSPAKWYGAMYYEVITRKIDKQTYYFLMGYNPGNYYSNKKILDVFYFDEYGYPFFGKPLFYINNKLQNRMVLEYNEKATISLHYNKKLKMIVFHHLVPIDNKYKNNHMFYGPDFTFDGLELKDDIWQLQEDIDVRNNF